jgi:hypothetical protein
MRLSTGIDELDRRLDGGLRPGSVVAPMAGGFLMADVGMEWVFYLGGLAAFSGVALFAILLSNAHGREAFTSW